MRFQKQRAGIVREAKKNEQNNKSIGSRGYSDYETASAGISGCFADCRTRCFIKIFSCSGIRHVLFFQFTDRRCKSFVGIIHRMIIRNPKKIKTVTQGIFQTLRICRQPCSAGIRRCVTAAVRGTFEPLRKNENG